MPVRKRSWTAPDGTPKQAWLVDYRDQAGKRRSKQFARKRDAEQWATDTSWQVARGVHTPDSQSVTVAAAAKLWVKRAEAEKLERATINQVLGHTHWNRKQAAHRLGVSYKTLLQKIKNCGLSPD